MGILLAYSSEPLSLASLPYEASLLGLTKSVNNYY